MIRAGLDIDDFDCITCYENSFYFKPDPAFYSDIAKVLGIATEECIMVGNDDDEDMVVKSIGMKVFLPTNRLINKGEKDISEYPDGSFEQLMSYL